ncbi:MAG: single-stranded DNA-binding protein [Deltaproteobacteria bacterium]|nr:single-stranded DNA-binding protein [Deltaproteobacteria bacterium]
MLSKVILIGFAGSKPISKQTSNGKVVANFSIATNETNGQKEKVTQWHQVTAWEGLAEIVTKYVDKGSLLYVEGRLKNQDYTNDKGVEVKTSEITLSEVKFLKSTDMPTKPVVEIGH